MLKRTEKRLFAHARNEIKKEKKDKKEIAKRTEKLLFARARIEIKKEKKDKKEIAKRTEKLLFAHAGIWAAQTGLVAQARLCYVAKRVLGIFVFFRRVSAMWEKMRSQGEVPLFRVEGCGLRVESSRYRVEGWGLCFEGLGSRV